MSAQMDLFKFAATISDLERQMTELLALRRAVCLLNAKRRQPIGARRARRRAFIDVTQSSMKMRPPRGLHDGAGDLKEFARRPLHDR